MPKPSLFRCFSPSPSPEVIRLAVMLYVRFPLSLRNVEDLLHDRGIEISHETVRFWWLRFGPMLAAEIRGTRGDRMRGGRQWHYPLDGTFMESSDGGTPSGAPSPTKEVTGKLRPKKTRYKTSALKVLCRCHDRETGRWAAKCTANS